MKITKTKEMIVKPRNCGLNPPIPGGLRDDEAVDDSPSFIQTHNYVKSLVSRLIETIIFRSGNRSQAHS